MKQLIFLLLCLTAFTTVIAAQETKVEASQPKNITQMSADTTPVKYQELRDELLKRMKADQDMRKEMSGKYAPGQPIPVDDSEKYKSVDRDNTEWIKTVIDKYGYPGYSMVGRQGEISAFLLIQHADQDKAFQKKVLELMRKAVEQKDANPTSLAYLTDRVQVAEGKLQIYGTQMQLKDGKFEPLPIEDEANVDKRRAEIGLPSLADYLKMMETRRPKPNN